MAHSRATGSTAADMRLAILPLSPRKRRVLDVLLLAWTVCWVVIGLRVGTEVRGLSDLSDTVTRSGVAISEGAEALVGLSELPLVGGQVDETAQRVREAGESARASGASSQESVRNLSVLLALAIAIIPSLPVIGFYLPLRLALVRDAKVVRRALECEDEDRMLEVLAGRAVHTLPYRQLRHITHDPIGDLRAGRYGPLAAAELERLGLSDRIPAAWRRASEGVRERASVGRTGRPGRAVG